MLCSIFVCNTQFTNAGFNEDWDSIQSEIKKFDESKVYISDVFQTFEESESYVNSVLPIFSNKNIFEKVKTNLSQINRSFNNIDALLTKILSENITPIEVGHLALFKFQEIKNEINSII